MTEPLHDDSTSWTADSACPQGETKEELLGDLERMMSDAKKYPVLEDKG